MGALQLFLWNIATRQEGAARRLLDTGGQAQAQVSGAEGRIIQGKSQYVVSYHFQAEGRPYQVDERLSLRQPDLPQAGQTVPVFYDRTDPSFSSLTDPRLTVHRIATLKMLTIGFGVFSYVFIWLAWRSRAQETPTAA